MHENFVATIVNKQYFFIQQTNKTKLRPFSLSLDGFDWTGRGIGLQDGLVSRSPRRTNVLLRT